LKAAIVTGGTSGIGRAISVALAGRGFQVVCFGLENLEEKNLKADILEADVSSASDVQRVVDFTLKKHGRIDALVHNAAIGPLGTVLDTDEALWERIQAVNLKGAYLCARAVIPHMVRQGGGAIVNIGSGAGWGKPNMAAYAASKGGLFALSAAMAYDHLHERIRVNTVVPGGGGIVSGMSLGRVGGDRSRLSAGATAAGRPVTGEDVARTVCFLLSDEAQAISGTVVDVGCFAHQGGPVASKKE
jgi:NAD(P)-dependent dehydrogenase (short-subunit alcohol dehydrogenase family)